MKLKDVDEATMLQWMKELEDIVRVAIREALSE